VKPFTGFTETLNPELVAPCKMETEFEEKAMEKSGAAGGGWMNEEEPPPQPAHNDAKRRRTALGTPWRNRPIE
jgi:hypothetical protein